MNKHIPKHLLPPKIPRIIKSKTEKVPFLIKRHFITLLAGILIFPLLGLDYFSPAESEDQDDDE